MIIEMMTKEAAKNLLQNLDPQAALKERTYTIVVPFMPISFKPEDNANLRQTERENRWNEGTVLTACWIKPVEKRTNTQRVAHILITFTDPTSANNAIRDGIAHYGHITKECIAHNDTCANCGNNHRTTDCTTKDKQYCIACETTDHLSRDRDCPTFIKRCESLDKRYPDNQLPYFPTNDEWTQATAPPKPPPYQKPPPPPPKNDHNQQPTLTQQRLDMYPMRN
ncbi:hypothetical protein P692DRAFT_20842749 [Suillus brevipes Sb2]|nr:hypothetical protein P692DRAFT_20842749 [Suillus brevipes Sb2]